MKQLRGKNWTLQEIADKYKLSRERVRQIVGNSNYKSAKTKRLKKAIRAPESDAMTNDELAKKLGVNTHTVSSHRGDRRHAIKRGSKVVNNGIDAEVWLRDKLTSLGFSAVLMPYGHKYDMLVNESVRVDVKKATKTWNPPSMAGKIGKAWRFAINNGHDDCDLFICITGKNDIFIIPSTVIPKKQRHIVFCFPTKRPQLGKYQKYHNRFDLIDTVKLGLPSD